MVAAGKVLLWSMMGLYDETLLLVKANVVWFVLSLPLGLPLLVLLAGVVPATEAEEPSVGWALPFMATGLVMLLVPNPASLGLHRLAATMQRKESPPWRQFWDATRENLKLGLALYAIGLGGLVILAVNTGFYIQAERGPWQALSVLWVYLGLFWLAIQLYLGPLVILLGERRILALYRRSALLVIAHPIYTLTFLLAIALVMLLCLVVVPLYLGLAMAFVALIGTRALGELKRKYDPEPDSDEEPA